ncbi:hypothetical protein EDWATA_01585 [Edwardsiella tarda ATCC 23685]|uniref:Uncharacterized protein n=1 Tax=Edwardsiella tarda ATCC 23685 TaxID=500638 RepID=D4F4B3_EDWTA|nr:hypothetical protein EDWATA_01585 [Edwardsiella tarda ATCC 23685]
MVIHETTHECGDLGAGLQTRGHLRTTQIQVAVLQAILFAVSLVKVQRQRLGAVDEGQTMAKDFDLPGRHLAVTLTLRASTHGAGDLHAKLVTQLRGLTESILMIRIKEHLHHPFAVTQIDEDQTTQVAAAMYPTAQGHFLAHMGQIQLPAIISTHNDILWLA